MLRHRIGQHLGLILFFASISLLLIASALPTLARSNAQPAAAVLPSPLAKIQLWVMEHTANGQQAEFLVVLIDQADLSGAEKFATKLEKGRFVYETLYQKAQSTQGPILKWLEDRGIEHRSYYIVNLIWVKADRSTATALASRPDVGRIEGNPPIRGIPEQPLGSIGPQSDQPSAVEPNITYVHAPQVWAMGFTGQGVVVGGQDTGYDWTHPALQPHYRGWNGITATHDFNWHDSIHSGGGSCDADSPVPCDDYSHGTHTMGTAVGLDSDSGGTNQIGMAPGAKWIGCRNMNQGVGTPTTYLECFEFFLAPYPVGGTPAQGDPSKAPDVTNNSWGCPFGPPPGGEGCVVDSLLAAVQAQRAAGIMTVVSAGNDGSSCSTTSDPPSYHDEVYTVGALSTGTDSIASFSSRGPVTADGSNRRKPDITAPGTSIRSSVPGGGYSSAFSGTSMAGPHVAGAVALLWSARPMLKNNIDLTEQILNQSAAHINNATCDMAGTTWPNNTYGYGRLDIKAAVDLAPIANGMLTGVVRNGNTSAPIAGASINATASPTMTGSAVTNATGVYTMPLISGVYTVSASSYGYHSAVITGVNVVSGTTTTLNITMTPTTFYTVSGVVKDALTSLPLTATITITGYPGGPILTDPATGAYSVSLSEDVTYTFGVRANPTGYGTITRVVGPLTANRIENFDLPPDLLACSAPGYTLVGVSEFFNTTITPTNWTVVNNASSAGWRFDNPGGRANLTGGAGNFAIADSDYAGLVSMDTELRSPVMNFSTLATATLKFKTDFFYYDGSLAEVADVDVSVNGASSPWTNVWRKTFNYRGPHAETIDLTSIAAGQSNVMIRFHYYNARREAWWQIDDVSMGDCQPSTLNQPALTPSTTAQSAKLGATVAYALQMDNVSSLTNTYTLTVASNWPALLSRTSIQMPPHATAGLTVSVTVPMTATVGSADEATVTMAGSNGAAHSHLTTTALWPYAIYLPVALKD